jgi:hypothetical protein
MDTPIIIAARHTLNPMLSLYAATLTIVRGAAYRRQP